MSRLEKLLQIHFAILTAIGGLLMSSGEVGIELPFIAVVAAIASYLMVDRWRILSLSTPLAYVGMGIVAAYSMVNFLRTGPDNQLMAVAQLLVLVLVVLQFQAKSLRVFEQIGVFCLLELIVAAVFNSALTFGLLLIPFSLVGLRALVLLQALTTLESSAPREDGGVATSSPFSISSISRQPKRFPRYGIVVLTPSVLLIAALFFYGLPRVGGYAESSRLGGSQTVGFAETLHLDQVGSLLQNPELVMRVTLTDERTNTRYTVRRPLYLRGQVLDSYDFTSRSGKWSVFRSNENSFPSFLPEPAYPEQRTSAILFDEVRVDIDQQPLTTDSLFSIPAYHSLWEQMEIEHLPGRWVLRRRPDSSEYFSSRINYRFGTHAFSNGIQNRYVRYFGIGEFRPNRSGPNRGPNETFFPKIGYSLLKEMTEFDSSKMPSLLRQARLIAGRLENETRSPFRLASEIETYLSTDPSFTYTTDLTQKRDITVDPIEEFMSQYRSGHCQYFASAMVMMLRSQNIPARVVVGYRTEEYNAIGGHYLVRQLHAHAWVEALIAEDDLPVGAMMQGQAKDGPVLVRFDPTPGSNEQEDVPARGVRHFYDFAQSLWNSYVLDMNSERQSQTLFGTEEENGLTNAYSRFVLQIQLWISRINAGQLGAGALSGGRLFSWRGAVLGIIGTLILFGMYQIGLPSWMRMKWTRRKAPHVADTFYTIDFYEQMCQKLAKIGLLRPTGQTPREFVQRAEAHFQIPATTPNSPLANLLHLYYRVRFGNHQVLSGGEQHAIQESLDHLQKMVDGAERVPTVTSELSNVRKKSF